MRDSSLYRKISGEFCLEQEIYSPWAGEPFTSFAELAVGHTLITTDRLYVIYSLVAQTRSLPGALVECGVYKGGSARMIAEYVKGNATLHIFDNFGIGLPAPDPNHDRHTKGEFADNMLDSVMAIMPDNVIPHPGNIPETFPDTLPDTIALAHIDVDLYRSVKDCCDWIYPRLVRGGVMIFDDYGGWGTPGCADAVDEFFADKQEFPLILQTGQAIVTKL